MERRGPARARRLVAVFVVALTACGGSGSESASRRSDDSGAATKPPIKVGALLPLSGPNAKAGSEMLEAAKLAAEDLNAAGGVLGRRIEIISGDDGCDPQMAADAAENLAATGIIGVAGGFCSGAALPATAVTDTKGIPFISAFATNPELTERGLPTVFRVAGRDDRQGEFAARFLAGPAEARKLAILHDNTVYAKGLAEHTRTANDGLKLGLEVVFFDAITQGQPDYRPTLTAIKASGADTLYFTGYPAEAGLIIRQAKEVAPSLRLTGGDGTTVPTVVEAAGAAAEGFVATTSPLPGFLPSDDLFTQAYSQRFGRAPGPYSVYEYDAVKVLANAVFWAGSTDPKHIVEALGTTRYEGLTGDISFDAKGDRETAIYVTAVVRDGRFRPHKKLDGRDNWVSADPT